MNDDADPGEGLPSWCHVGERLRGEYSGAPRDAALPAGLSPLETILGATRLGTASALKIWGGMLHLIVRSHTRDPSELLLLPHLDRWYANPGDAEFPEDFAQAPPYAEALDSLPGEVGFDARGLRSFRVGEAMPDNWRLQAWIAPELLPGVFPTPRADVFLVANLALALLTHGRVATRPTDVPRVLDAIRRWRPTLPPRVQLVLVRSLALNPESRYADAAEALQALRDAVRIDLAAARTPPRRHGAEPVVFRQRGVGPAKLRDQAKTFLPPERFQDDVVLVHRLADDTFVAAVLDGVSTTSVGQGLLAAEAATVALAGLADPVANGRPLAQCSTTRALSDARRWLLGALAGADEDIRLLVESDFSAAVAARAATPTTTCVAVLVRGDLAVVAALGDSPAWLLTPAGAALLTWPMTVRTEEMFKHAASNAGESHVDRAALTGCLGDLRGEATVPHLVSLRLDARSLLVLASDGVTEFLGVPPTEFFAELARELLGTRDLATVAHTVFHRTWLTALQHESRDNMSLVVIGVTPGAEAVPLPDEDEDLGKDLDPDTEDVPLPVMAGTLPVLPPVSMHVSDDVSVEASVTVSAKVSTELIEGPTTSTDVSASVSADVSPDVSPPAPVEVSLPVSTPHSAPPGPVHDPDEPSRVHHSGETSTEAPPAPVAAGGPIAPGAKDASGALAPTPGPFRSTGRGRTR